MDTMNDEGRREFDEWNNDLNLNSYSLDQDLRHTIAFHLPDKFQELDQKLEAFAEKIIHDVIPLVRENNLPENLPKLVRYDPFGNPCNFIKHHPSYEQAGNLIYSSGLMNHFARDGGLTEGLCYHLISSFAGEAGHNCPIACSAGIQRVLRKICDHPQKDLFLSKLKIPSYVDNYTGAQFVTEIQGGSDVGKNATTATDHGNGHWRISGEKWFCSNADADLFLVIARYLPDSIGTKGLGLFLIPAKLESGEDNGYVIRRLKDKLGTRTLATAEIEFKGALGFPMGPLENGFKSLMENVLHLSRLFNSICVIGMARRALYIATSYAKRRSAFGNPIFHYPLVKEQLARIKSENNALLSSIFATLQLQDAFDLSLNKTNDRKLLLRLLANLNKYLSAKWTVEHIHHSLDVLAGNGTIETFSSIPQLLRDSIICENWEGTHNTLRMQVLKDILRYQVDDLFTAYVEEVLSQLQIEHPLTGFLNSVRNSFVKLKDADPAMQSLLIKQVVDQMACLFASAHLLLEALDQQKNQIHSKMQNFDYFVRLHSNLFHDMNLSE